MKNRNIDRNIDRTLLKCFGKLTDSIITMETKIQDLDIDDLDQIEILMDIENKFNISIPDDDVELMYNGTIGNLKIFLRKYGVIDIKEVRKEKLDKIYEKN